MTNYVWILEVDLGDGLKPYNVYATREDMLAATKSYRWDVIDSDGCTGTNQNGWEAHASPWPVHGS